LQSPTCTESQHMGAGEASQHQGQSVPIVTIVATT
jgi:hypothetical protein